ncbi:MAG TPA: site-specific integrase [Candidatus Acutalibacter ornithocaccae]|uniref:Site-specific integrase n=1 Tax=Candidatus Acutalibacter ornithocaccae TaxID=2838416 RepID=A0A9D2RXX9_9FIRM|nr:site-specific integrase [Candidatus Acutalibacter ornithocaccae]
MAAKPHFAASVQSKKGRLYAVMQVKKDGTTKPVWRALGLSEGANKTKVNKAFREVVAQYEQEFWEEQERGGRPPADIPVYDYLVSYLKRVEPELQKNTIVSYRSMTNGKIRRYFQRRPQLTVGNLKPQDIQDFYQSLFADGVVANTVIHYHALLRRAFQQAFKEERIEANPFDRVGRPKKNKFHGENYTQEELLTLLHLARGDVIYPAILLAGAMGLRRSEALGVRWSRIDWEKRTVLLDTKIVEYRENGKKKVEPVEEMKNKSSRRTLPLPDPVVEMLQVQKEHREVYRKMFQGSYNTQYLDYVCVNQLGELLRPSYVTDHFRELLEKYGLRHIRFHDLRHTFASLLINQDVPLINVSNFLGHSDLSTTANIYAHLDKASKQASAAVISDILQGENRHAQPKGEPETNTDRQT